MFRGSIKQVKLILLVVLLLSTIMGVIVPVSAHSDQVFADIYDQVSPSVVSISVVARRSDTTFFNQDETVIGGGTGFVLDTDGYILTNNHVVEGATEIEVSFVDGTLISARIIGLDPDSDLAVIQVDLPEEELSELQPVTFGDSDALRIGETVLAIGSPFGQRWTLTSGIVSAINRNIQGLTNFSIGGVIQTDAAINPGNSGGPMLDLNGNVVGVNSQIISRSGSNAGIGFAIPGNLAQRVAQELIENGFVDYSYLGISGRDVFLPLLESFNLPNDTQGVVIDEVVPGGPASRAGLQSATYPDDTDSSNPRVVPETVEIITTIDGEPLSGISELIGFLAAETEPGQTVTLNVLRLDSEKIEEMQFEVRLTPRP